MARKKFESFGSNPKRRLRKCFLTIDSTIGFLIRPKCVVVVAGISGSGKSTFIRELMLGRIAFPIPLPSPFRAPLSKHSLQKRPRWIIPSISIGLAVIHVEINRNLTDSSNLAWITLAARTSRRILVIIDPSVDRLNSQRLQRFKDSVHSSSTSPPPRVSNGQKEEAYRTFTELVSKYQLSFEAELVYNPETMEFASNSALSFDFPPGR